MSHKLIGMLMVSCMLSSGAVLAGDGKSLPASMCDGATAQERNMLLKNVTGTLENDDSYTTVYVTCPGVRDVMAGKSGGIEYSFMNYINRSGGRGYCRLMSMEQNGRIYTHSTRSMVSTTSARSLTFGKISTKSSGNNLIYCSLPAKAELLTYRIDERT